MESISVNGAEIIRTEFFEDDEAYMSFITKLVERLKDEDVRS